MEIIGYKYKTIQKLKNNIHFYLTVSYLFTLKIEVKKTYMPVKYLLMVVYSNEAILHLKN